MKQFIKKVSLLLLFTIISKSNFSQQILTNQKEDKQLICQFNSYSNEKDKLLHFEFNSQINYKIIFSCIPSGITVIESLMTLSANEIALIKEKLNNLHISYTIISNVSIKDIEENCATYRSN